MPDIPTTMKASILVSKHVLPYQCISGPRDGGRYDLSDACPECGTGAQRLDPLRFPISMLRDRVSYTLTNEVVIPPRLVAPIRSVAPRCLRVICDKAGKVSSYFELVPEVTLIPWSANTTGWCTSKLEPSCPKCRRDGYFNVPKQDLRIVYDSEVAPFSVGATYERFGKSRLRNYFRESHFAVSQILVAGAVEKILSGEKGISFIPVNFVVNESTEPIS